MRIYLRWSLCTLYLLASGEGCRRRLRCLLCFCDVFRALINSLRCSFLMFLPVEFFPPVLRLVDLLIVDIFIYIICIIPKTTNRFSLLFLFFLFFFSHSEQTLVFQQSLFFLRHVDCHVVMCTGEETSAVIGTCHNDVMLRHTLRHSPSRLVSLLQRRSRSVTVTG